MQCHLKSQWDAPTAVAILKLGQVMPCPPTNKGQNIRDGRGMVSDPVNGPGSARQKAVTLLSTNGMASTITCSGIPNLCRARNVLSELEEAVV